MVYQDCESCNEDTGEYVYFVEGCNQQFGDYATSADPNIPVGTVMKYIEDGTNRSSMCYCRSTWRICF